MNSYILKLFYFERYIYKISEQELFLLYLDCCYNGHSRRLNKISKHPLFKKFIRERDQYGENGFFIAYRKGYINVVKVFLNSEYFKEEYMYIRNLSGENINNYPHDKLLRLIYEFREKCIIEDEKKIKEKIENELLSTTRKINPFDSYEGERRSEKRSERKNKIHPVLGY